MEPRTFDEVLSEERDAINRARAESMLPRTDRFSGLAVSGGGIRSATFNLGMLQALARLKLLQHFDYLSTVSGGGYVGSWLSALIKREGKGEVRGLMPKLAGDPSAIGAAAEYPAIQFLRRYSNYLTPRLGLFSADSLTFVATVIRNLYLNLTVLVLFASAALMLPRLLVRLGSTLDFGALSAILVSVGLLLVAIVAIAVNMGYEPARNASEALAADAPAPRYTQTLFILLFVVVPTLAAAYVMTQALAVRWHDWGPNARENDAVIWVAIVAPLYLAAWAIGFGLMRIVRASGEGKRPSALPSSTTAQESETRARTVKDRLKIICCALVAGAAGALLLRLFAEVSSGAGGIEARNWLLAGIGTPLMLKVYSLVVALHVGLAKHSFSEQQREWWSRLAAWVMIVGVAWFTLFVAAILGPPLWQSVSNWLMGGGALWLATTAAGVWFAKGERTTGFERRGWRDAIAIAAPYVFIGGLLLVLAIAVHEVLALLSPARCKAEAPSFGALLESAACEMNRGDRMLFLAFATCVAGGLLMAWRIDINIFSLHHFYRNRLTRAYLGATRSLERAPQSFTGFDVEDDLAMNDLSSEKDGQRIYQRPYHLLNAALNLAHGQDLAWQSRKAASFVFTPRYCGFELPAMDPAAKEARANRRGGYRSSAHYLNGIRLGAAMAISGSAVSPNMGFHTSAPLAVLMTVFNVRLGRWCGNPLHDKAWRERGPTMSARYLMNELFSLTTMRSPFLYLSDGGHFENLGIYELVRRRCHFIVACDAAQDERFAFEDLGNAIRKCQADFGIEIELDVERLRIQKESGRSLAYFAAGTIHYEQRYADVEPGMIFYIKPALTGKEPSDILNYATVNAAFPHQTTSDQWFDESQFESYRKLGNHIAMQVFSSAKKEAGDDVAAFFHTLKRAAAGEL